MCPLETATTSRRSILRAAAGIGLAGLAVGGAFEVLEATAAQADATPGDRLVMLGVNGGPLLLPPHYQPATALIAGGQTYLVDCGGDTVRQMTRAGLGFAGLRNILLTHRHLDHTAGLPALGLLGWVYPPSPLRSLDLWGPPGTTATGGLLLGAYSQEIRLFEVGIALPPIPVAGHDLNHPVTQSGIFRVMEDAQVTVDLTPVNHGPEVPYAFAYRFTIKSTGKRIVFSGDTTYPCANLVALAAGADVLVHEVMDVDAIETMLIAQAPPAQQESIREHLLNSHSNVVDVPAVAKAAGAARLVLNHYVPAQVPPATFLAKAQAAADSIGYQGTITAPTDLDSIAL